MKSKLKLLLVAIALFALPLSTQPYVSASTVETAQPKIYAKAAIAVDANTGQILYQKNANQPLAIASISKLMTIYIVHQQISQGKLSWNDHVKITPAVAKLSTASGLTNVPLKSGHSYSVRALVNATLVASANAAAIALGQEVSGSSSQFAAKMNQTAKKLGITDAKFYNASGLTNKLTGGLALKGVNANAENELSASDVALLASRLLKRFPKVTQITSQAQSSFYGTAISGHNELLGNKQIARGAVVDGLKTGTSDKAGACFVGSATRQHHRIITVVLGTRNDSATDPARFIQTAKLMKFVFTKQHPIIVSKNSQVKGVHLAKVPDGKQTSVDVVNQKKTWVWAPKAISRKQITAKYLHHPKKIAAPAKKNTSAGTARLLANGQAPKYLATYQGTIKLFTNKSVKKANPFVLLWRAILRLF
ncbi:D-alanyl-D-alanine carboxypeptidase family protein [Lentilactobacillus diolivorans]|uniref:serine-type D-Ala-D-Ala carboxypeptidase n=2 Tax=Lentilactobacillus diolivorans TaxID=179838 RepID=A0A0R1SA61_9LACO|nr:D-alanyl-D-alanine carboxypeptidase family protein [Lentilactobacillus diolivorans]KRL65936.1 serine-type D-Ala-D-Ala carboxypeptidase [Lentilactobacillus diolivorans DSM 14421]GEP24868.1 D-alanyl-D-alanine carboxypeptidase [Lentilactobacillus diolivorans]